MMHHDLAALRSAAAASLKLWFAALPGLPQSSSAFGLAFPTCTSRYPECIEAVITRLQALSVPSACTRQSLVSHKLLPNALAAL